MKSSDSNSRFGSGTTGAAAAAGLAAGATGLAGATGFFTAGLAGAGGGFLPKSEKTKMFVAMYVVMARQGNNQRGVRPTCLANLFGQFCVSVFNTS